MSQDTEADLGEMSEKELGKDKSLTDDEERSLDYYPETAEVEVQFL